MLLDAKSGHRARPIGIADIIAVLYFHILNISRVYARPHTPKDNPVDERFNRTIQKNG
jgi:transketolase